MQLRAIALLLRSSTVRQFLVALILGLALLGFYVMTSGTSLLAAALGGSADSGALAPQLIDCSGPAVIAPQTTAADLTDAQRQTAADIIGVGRSLGIPDHGLIIAIATSMQESGLRPINYGDRDSLGPFQQRTSWGPADQRINAVTSAQRFFSGGDAGQRGLLKIPGWQQMTVTQAAQAVQVSAFPDAYAKWEPLAADVVTGTVAGPSAPACLPAG